MDLDQLIKRYLSKTVDEYEVRKSSCLSQIHGSIDVLADNASHWFGDSIPKEFKNALNQLMNISIMYHERCKNITGFNDSHEYTRFNVTDILYQVRDEIESYSDAIIVKISEDESAQIYTSDSILKESIIYLLFSILQYEDSGTSVEISVRSESSKVSIIIRARNLKNEIPDVQHLIKKISSVHVSDDYSFRIGVDLPLSDIRKIGGVSHVETRNDGKDIYIQISFPSHDFMEAVEEIRNRNKEEKRVVSGNIALFMQDYLLEIIFKEQLSEIGFFVVSVNSGELKFLENKNFKAVVTDADIGDELSGISDNSNIKYVFVSNRDVPNVRDEKKIKVFRIPLEIQSVVDFIEEK